MAIIQRCCCLTNVRTGSIYAAIYSLISSLVYIGLVVLRFYGVDRIATEDNKIMVYATFGLFGPLVVVSFLLFVAVWRDFKWLFLPYLIVAAMALVLASVTTIFLLVEEMQLNRGKVEDWEVGLTIFHCVNFCIGVYCWICVFSQLQNLLQGVGTKEYHKKQKEKKRLKRLELMVPCKHAKERGHVHTERCYAEILGPDASRDIPAFFISDRDHRDADRDHRDTDRDYRAADRDHRDAAGNAGSSSPKREELPVFRVQDREGGSFQSYTPRQLGGSGTANGDASGTFIAGRSWEVEMDKNDTIRLPRRKRKELPEVKHSTIKLGTLRAKKALKKLFLRSSYNEDEVYNPGESHDYDTWKSRTLNKGKSNNSRPSAQDVFQGASEEAGSSSDYEFNFSVARPENEEDTTF